MAYTKVFAIRARLDDRVKYAINGDKTELGEKINYAADLQKMNSVRFVSALNCKSAETAFAAMRRTKEKFCKTGGVLGYHFIQSFAPGEVTPEQAHEIGCEFARRLFGEDFEVVVGTHLDKAHPHNHIIVKIGRVFDVTQTHGKAVPAPLTLRDNTPEMEAALSRLLDSAGVPVVTDAAMYQDAFYDPKAQRITVSTRLSDSKTFAALAREIVHAGIHDRGRYPYYSREDCAMDAECVSYMLCRNFSIDVPQPNVSRVGQAFDGMEAQDRRSVVDSLQKYFRRLQKDIQREISPQERKQPEQNRTVR